MGPKHIRPARPVLRHTKGIGSLYSSVAAKHRRGVRSSLAAPCGKTLERTQLLTVTDLRLCNRVPEPFNRSVINRAIHGIRMAVLSAVREAEPRGIAQTRRLSINHIGDERERANCFGTYARNGEHLLETFRRRLVGREQNFSQM